MYNSRKCLAPQAKGEQRCFLTYIQICLVLCLLFCVLAFCCTGCKKNEDLGTKDASVVTEIPSGTSTNAPTKASSPTVTPTCTPLPVDPDANTLLPEEPDNGESLVIENHDLIHTQYDNNAEERKQLFDTLSASKNLPVIHIETLDQKAILSKDTYTTAIVDVTNCEEQYVLSADAGVKVRGNSTSNDVEKPYRIKFTEKQSMLGLHDGKAYRSWVLMRCFWFLASDFTAFNLYHTISNDAYYASDCTFVSVYVNGDFRGFYLLCEQNQVAKGRIDVNEPKKEEFQNETGYLIELDNYAGDEHPFFSMSHEEASFTDMNGTTAKFLWRNYSVKSKINTVGQLAFIENYTKGVFHILLEASKNKKAYVFDTNYQVVEAPAHMTPEQAVAAVMDLDSAVYMLILEELTHNYDVGAGSFYMAVDFSESGIYKKLTFLAPWDFNWAFYEEPDDGFFASTFQTPEPDGYDRSNSWFVLLMSNDWFVKRVKARWQSMMDKDSLNSLLDDLRPEIEATRNDLPHDDSWRTDCGLDILTYVENRILWLDKQWGR